MVLLIVLALVAAPEDVLVRDTIREVDVSFAELQRTQLPERYTSRAKTYPKPTHVVAYKVDDQVLHPDIPSIVTCEYFTDWVLITVSNRWHKGDIITVRPSSAVEMCASAADWPQQIRDWYDVVYGGAGDRVPKGWRAVPGSTPRGDRTSFLYRDDQTIDGWGGFPCGMVGDRLFIDDEGSMRIVDVRTHRMICMGRKCRKEQPRTGDASPTTTPPH